MLFIQNDLLLTEVSLMIKEHVIFETRRIFHTLCKDGRQTEAMPLGARPERGASPQSSIFETVP